MSKSFALPEKNLIFCKKIFACRKKRDFLRMLFGGEVLMRYKLLALTCLTGKFA